MKKIILCGLLLCGTLSFAQTTTPTKATTTVPTAVVPTTTTQPKTVVAPKTTQPQTTVAPKIDPALESIAKNIDRRLMFFNRYKQSADMENLAQLVSDKNKDFYINFIKYVKTAPLFTVKRDLVGRIIKAPNNEYIFPIIVTLDGKDRKVSMTFVEEKTEQASKWLIVNSNLHIQSASPNTNLGSSAVTGTNTPSVKTPTTTPTIPVVKNPAPALPVVAPAASAGLSMATIILIALASIVILGGIVGYYLFAKHRKAKIIAASLAAAAASTVSASTPVLPEVPLSPETPVSPPVAPITPVVPASNVTVSSVEEIHNAVPSAPVTMKETPQEENISKPISLEGNAPEMAPSETVIAAQDNIVSPIVPKENENIHVSTEQTTPSVPTLSLETISATKESYDNEQEKVLKIASQPESSPAPVIDSSPLTVPPVEMPISDIFTAPPAPDNTAVQNTETRTPNTPNPLFG